MAGAVVFVDDKRVGEVPVQAVLAAGNHRVRVRHAGYDDANTRAVVTAGGRSELAVPLDKPPPLTSRWWFWTGVGVVVVGGAVLAYAL